MSDNREQARREKALAWERGRIPNTQDISDQNFAGDNSVSPGSWGRIHGFLAGHRAASEEARTMSEKEVLTLLAANHSLKAEIAALRELLKKARVAMMEPHGEWKDHREADAVVAIREFLEEKP